MDTWSGDASGTMGGEGLHGQLLSGARIGGRTNPSGRAEVVGMSG